MLDRGYLLAVIIAMGVVTFALRALPFVAAQWLQRHPVVGCLGRFLPPAIMLLLLLHAMVGAAAQHRQGPWPEVLGVTLVVALQLWRGNALLSILAGTAAYVLLRNPGLL